MIIVIVVVWCDAVRCGAVRYVVSCGVCLVWFGCVVVPSTCLGCGAFHLLVWRGGGSFPVFFEFFEGS